MSNGRALLGRNHLYTIVGSHNTAIFQGKTIELRITAIGNIGLRFPYLIGANILFLRPIGPDKAGIGIRRADAVISAAPIHRTLRRGCIVEEGELA